MPSNFKAGLNQAFPGLGGTVPKKKKRPITAAQKAYVTPAALEEARLGIAQWMGMKPTTKAAYPLTQAPAPVPAPTSPYNITPEMIAAWTGPVAGPAAASVLPGVRARSRAGQPLALPSSAATYTPTSDLRAAMAGWQGTPPAVPAVAAGMTSGQAAQLASLRQLSTDLRSIGANMAARRTSPLGPVASVTRPLAQQAAPSVASMIENPVSYQRHLAAGTYSRPTPGLERLTAQAAPTPQQELAAAISAASPGLAEQQAVQSTLEPGKSLGYAAPAADAANIQEYAAAMRNWRDTIAAGGTAPYPGSFRTVWDQGPRYDAGTASLVSGGRPGAEAALAAEAKAKERRESRRAEFAGMYVAKDIRQRVATAQRQGRNITPAMAMIEKKIENDKPLSPAEMLAYFGALGQQQVATETAAKTAEAEQKAAAKAQSDAAIATILSGPLAGSLPRQVVGQLIASIQGAAAGAASGLAGAIGEGVKLTSLELDDLAGKSNTKEDFISQGLALGGDEKQLTQEANRRFKPGAIQKFQNLVANAYPQYEKYQAGAGPGTVLPSEALDWLTIVPRLVRGDPTIPKMNIPSKILSQVQKMARSGDQDAKRILNQIALTQKRVAQHRNIWQRLPGVLSALNP